MVDVGAKDVTERIATAEGRVTMRPATLELIRGERLPKGDVLGVAQLAGIMAAKRRADLIPLCHPLPLTLGRRRARRSSQAPAPSTSGDLQGQGPHRRRDGGADRRRGRGAHRLRHVQGGRSRHA